MIYPGDIDERKGGVRLPSPAESSPGK